MLRALPTYTAITEPYDLLEEEGHESAEMPSLEDFELQLERSMKSLAEGGEDLIFDRCPADILAYLITHGDSEGFDLDPWLPRVRRAMERLDLIVFVPVEHPDRVANVEPDHAALRRRVDEELRDVLLNDRWEIGMDVLEVIGTSQERARQVLARARP